MPINSSSLPLRECTDRSRFKVIGPKQVVAAAASESLPNLGPYSETLAPYLHCIQNTTIEVTRIFKSTFHCSSYNSPRFLLCWEKYFCEPNLLIVRGFWKQSYWERAKRLRIRALCVPSLLLLVTLPSFPSLRDMSPGAYVWTLLPLFPPFSSLCSPSVHVQSV